MVIVAIIMALMVLVIMAIMLLAVQNCLLACLQRALNLSDEQSQDLLHVQHLMLIKESLLELERKVEPLIKTEQVELPHDSFAALEADSHRLRNNLLQIQKLRFEAGTVVFAGV